MRILVLITGEYGRRHVDNMGKHAPVDWRIEVWTTPKVLPPILDYPEDYLPESLPKTDLILSLAELPGVAEMIPDIARMTGARSVIAPIDSQAWLPFGLARQLGEWLARDGVACVAPMPFCSLTETHINALRQRTTYEDPLIREFARFFGQPAFSVEVDRENTQVRNVEVTRDACCGCARYVAEKMAGIPPADALEQAGLLHHHYPCQASMGIDPLYGDTLMHVSGNIMKDAMREALGDDLPVTYIRPGGFVEKTEEPR
ncbi:MAG: thymidylate synthase [Anaerolineae bacterium]|nr:thymidylate synthase [Anaerolineae bacterium]